MRTAPIARRAVLLLALLAAPLALAPEAKQPGSAWKSGSLVPAVIVRWHDGDTLTASALGEQLRVRLIGIDAPEVSDNPRARDQARRLGVPVSEVLALWDRPPCALPDSSRQKATRRPWSWTRRPPTAMAGCWRTYGRTRCW